MNPDMRTYHEHGLQSCACDSCRAPIERQLERIARICAGLTGVRA